MELADRVLPARVVCICAPMPVDPCYRQTRNQFLALPDHHGGIFVCAGGHRLMDHLSGCRGAAELTAGVRMNGILDSSLVGLALLVSAAYALASLGPRSLRRPPRAGLSRL